MIGDVKVKIDGKEHVLRLTLGALEEVSETEVAPAVIIGALSTDIYNTKEIRAVLGAALKASGSEYTVDDLTDTKLGMSRSKALALDLMVGFFEDKSGNADAAPKTVTPDS